MSPVPFLLVQGCDGGVMVDVVRIREFRSGVTHACVPASSPVWAQQDVQLSPVLGGQDLWSES